SGKPTLFFLALDKVVGAAWTLGTNYYKVNIPIDETLAATQPTGMSNFSALYGANGEVTQIYAGDFHGKVWKLNFTDLNNKTSGYKPTTDWNMDKLSSFNRGTATSPLPYPFYIAKDSAGNVQPITVAPSLFTGPIVKGVESFYVLIGTGKYLESGDNLSTRTQSVYALYDNGSTSADASPIVSAISGRSRLQAGTVDTSTRKINITAFTWGRPETNADATQRSGWYFDLPATGEKLVSSISDLGNLTATFNTLIPGISGAAAACTTNEGSGKQYTVNVASGKGDYVESIVGVLGESIFLTNADKTEVSKFDSTGRAIRKTTKQAIQVGSKGTGAGKSVVVEETIGRLSWRQIYNYQDLRNK
ncbi:MAG: hypothetical protein K2W88_08565, partial [Pararheinheimera sp.]|nr:hypothetical protein [Rheinheimera sp.]